uniref:Uncharacterized protein n=1 Tax=Loa loa TaxID=7209 RepID=A0A1I7W256_LOALO
MTKRRSSQPDIRSRTDSQSSLMRRRSITETYPRPSVFGGRPIHNVRELLEANLEETPLIYTEMLDLDKDDKARRQWKQIARGLYISPLWDCFAKAGDGFTVEHNLGKGKERGGGDDPSSWRCTLLAQLRSQFSAT